MPAAGQLLGGLANIANSWKAVALFWHLYFGAIVLILVLGIRSMKRTTGLLLAFPLFSVSAMAWMAANPFNGAVFALLGILLVSVSVRLGRDSVKISRRCFFIAGAFMFAFGWLYPHFLKSSSLLPYLYMAPTGLVPCPTLAIVIGLALILEGLDSRALCGILGAAGLFYGIFGVARLGVALDWGLVLGAIVILFFVFNQRSEKKLNK